MSIERMADNMLKKLGYGKVAENGHGVTYKRISNDFNYTQELVIMRKINGRHIIQSYDERCIRTEDGGFVNQVCGVELKVLFPLWVKSKCMARRYNW